MPPMITYWHRRNRIRLREFVESIVRLCGLGLAKARQRCPIDTCGQLEVDVLIADPSKARAKLGWAIEDRNVRDLVAIMVDAMSKRQASRRAEDVKVHPGNENRPLETGGTFGHCACAGRQRSGVGITKRRDEFF